ncbi:MAG: hypothetical protein LIO87_00570 [Eubacterium sp.]|nr:hypothetical protein [Eubacterium sp.]MCC8174529.1 hypothetical protein [Odoribacter sp.]
MKYKKTPRNKRNTYKLYDDNGNFVSEYKPGKDGITEVDIINLHKIDDHEVYINSKESKHPEWFQPSYDEWKNKFIDDFKEKMGRVPFNDEIPNRHRLLESIEAQETPDEDELGDSSKLEAEIAVPFEEDIPDSIIRLREIVADMPEQWQKIYRLVNIEGFSKAKTGRIVGISDVRVGQLIKKINKLIAEDEILKNLFR